MVKENKKLKEKHPSNCKGCPDCPAIWTCKCGRTFSFLNTEHKCNIKVECLNRWQILLFWYAVIISLGLLFLMAYVFDNIKPKELIKYVHKKGV